MNNKQDVNSSENLIIQQSNLSELEDDQAEKYDLEHIDNETHYVTTSNEEHQENVDKDEIDEN